ncbi:DNA-directed RNA polymerase subunit omega [bacterium]|nr:DNA-directed RNA polymerase subunit omega [bacterium]
MSLSTLFPRPDILLNKFANVYILVLIAARRAKQLEQGALPLLTVPYLQARFGSVEAMNREWGTSFRSFEEVLRQKSITLALLEILEDRIAVGRER